MLLFLITPLSWGNVLGSGWERQANRHLPQSQYLLEKGGGCGGYLVWSLEDAKTTCLKYHSTCWVVIGEKGGLSSPDGGTRIWGKDL